MVIKDLSNMKVTCQTQDGKVYESVKDMPPVTDPAILKLWLALANGEVSKSVTKEETA